MKIEDMSSNEYLELADKMHGYVLSLPGLPTVRKLAKKYNVSQSVILSIIEDSPIENKYFDLKVAWGIPNGGISEIEIEGNYLVEAY